jgi:hypothetical protein
MPGWTNWWTPTGMDPLKSCVLCHQSLPQHSAWDRREAVRQHFASAHVDLFQALLKYEDDAAWRVNRVILPTLFLWLFVLGVVVFWNAGRVPWLFVVIWFDVFVMIGFGGAASLIPRWRAFLRLMKPTPALCRVCDVETTVEGEYEHVRVAHPDMYWRMRAVRTIVYLVIGGPFVVMMAGFHLYMLDFWSVMQFEAIALWTALAFLLAVVLLGLWLWTLGPRSIRRIRKSWRTGHAPRR